MIRLARFALTSAFATAIVTACGPGETPPTTARPTDVPELHHAGLNALDPAEAVRWYGALWPDATEATFAGHAALAAEMYLVFAAVDEPPAGAFDPELGRPADQSAFWHIGAFVNTTDLDVRLGGLGVDHLPLHTGPEDDATVWRSGLTPYEGIVTAQDRTLAADAPARPGGFSYVLGPDGALFELTGGPNTSSALAHVHLFHEQPMCAANWYVTHLGFALPPLRNDDGTTDPRPAWDPCEADLAAPGWPSLEAIGTIRDPRATVVHGNGSISFYPRQCHDGRCGADQPLVPSRGQVLDHVAFRVSDVDAWHRWLAAREVRILETPHDIPEGRAVMLEGPDGLAIELVALTDAPAPSGGTAP